MKKLLFIVLLSGIISMFFLVGCAGKGSVESTGTDSLAYLFKTPTHKSGIRCWWWWLNANVTKESITSDLEAMKEKGFSGASIIDAGGDTHRGNGPVPAGPKFGSPAWQELYIYAVNEAERLDLELGLMIQSGWNVGGPDVTVEESNKHLTWSEVRINGGVAIERVLPEPPAKEGFYRDIAVLAFPAKEQMSRPPIRNLQLKAAFGSAGMSAPKTWHLLTDTAGMPGEEDALTEQVQDITSSFDADNGVLTWEAPPGDWVVMRFGYTTSNARVKTSSKEWQGYMIDFMSKKRFNRYWDSNVKPLLDTIGSLAGTTLKYVQTDSWEGGGLNWTELFRDEFKNRRGYDLLPYLPVVAGKIIENRDVSNRFLADLRKTVGDCIAENHYGVFAERAKEYGIGILPESAGPHGGPFDGLKNYGKSQIMMSEFWAPSPHRPKPVDRFFVKQASSAAHIYNRHLVGAEAFTTIGKHWNDVIWSDLKSSFDHEVCAGLNLVYLHTFASSPKEMGLPGQAYFAGTHINPNITWWDMSGAFFDYMARIQYMMQQGRFVADVLYYYGDHVPNIAGRKADDPAKALPEYDYDVINEEMLLTLHVKNKRVTLPHGMSYRILALPVQQFLSLAAARKVEELVEAGAIIVGPKPNTTGSLVNYPQSETELKKIADKLWGNTSEPSGIRETGKGKVIWGMTAREALMATHVQPDFLVKSDNPDAVIDYIHHTLPGMDYYFVSNQREEITGFSASFRVTGKQPELWDPVTGEIRDAKAFRQEGGRTIVPLDLNPYGSVFVVFRRSIGAHENGESERNSPVYQPLLEITGPWDLQFDPEWGGPIDPVKFDSLRSWTEHEEAGIRYYSGKVVYTKHFEYPALSENGDIVLDLGQIHDVGIARVTLNGKDLGVVWTPPYRVKITDVLRSESNELKVEVVNSWRNRLVGDRGKPKDQRLTSTNINVLEEWELLPSGLLGPVQLLTSAPKLNKNDHF